MTGTVRDFKGGVTRIDPVLPVGAYQTYRIDAPVETHWRPATCEEFECSFWANGWTTTVPANSPEEMVIRRSGRKWERIERNPDKTLSFIFPAGTTCFKVVTHRVSLEREPKLLVVGGDWRGIDRDYGRTFNNAEEFLDHFANHQERLAKKIMDRR